MTQPTNKQVTPLTEFVDSIFAELSSHTSVWNVRLEGYGYYDNPDCWKDTLIPLAIRLYQLAQVDDKVYWWLLQLMSHVNFCKDWKEDLGKRDVFTMLSMLKRKHQRIVLEKCVPAYADELQKALDDNSLDTFRSVLPTTNENVTVCNICRVLKRATEVQSIYDDTMFHTEGDSLGKLFVLFRQYYYYFTDACKENPRSCDGMAINIFLALYRTQFCEDKVSFCSLADRIGGLWVRSLMLAYFQFGGQMPLAVKEVLQDVLQSQNADDFVQMEDDFKDNLTEEKNDLFFKSYGGWLEIENYSFIYRDVFERERPIIIPPFSCKIVGQLRESNSRCKIKRMKKDIPDNCVPSLKSKNAIPLEELKAAMVDNPSPVVIIPLINEEGVGSGLAKHNNETDFPNVEVASENNSNIAEETLNQKARRLIGELLLKLEENNKMGCSIKKWEKFFDAILIDERKYPDEKAAQSTIVKDLFNYSSKYEYKGLKLLVFCRILGYLQNLNTGMLVGEPQSIAEVLQSCLTKPKDDPESTNNLRSYIQKAKDGTAKPPERDLIKKVLGI